MLLRHSFIRTYNGKGGPYSQWRKSKGKGFYWSYIITAAVSLKMVSLLKTMFVIGKKNTSKIPTHPSWVTVWEIEINYEFEFNQLKTQQEWMPDFLVANCSIIKQNVTSTTKVLS